MGAQKETGSGPVPGVADGAPGGSGLTMTQAESAAAARAAAAVGDLRLLSTLPFEKSPFWVASVVSIRPRHPSRPGRWSRLWARLGAPDPGHILRMLRAAPHADAVMINGGERADLFYLALAGLLPWIRAPHLIIDAHWQPGETRLRRGLQRVLLSLGSSLLAEVQVHSPEEIPLYQRNFGLARRVLCPLPWSTSLKGYAARRRVEEGFAVVTGGHSYRDYATLLAAAAGQPWTLHIGLPPSHATEAVQRACVGLSNVQIMTDWTLEEYWQQVADSRVFAMAIEPGLQRCTADQTILNAMALGTVVVATSSLSSRLYIRDELNGFLVAEGDVDGWRRTLDRVLSLPPDRARQIREAAQQAATTTFSEDERLLKTLERAAAAARQWAGGPLSPRRLALRRRAGGLVAALAALLATVGWAQL